MPTTNRPDKPRSCSESQADRIRFLLERRWGGNQNEMARAIGCSQSSLCRVVNGQSQPGKRLLQLIATHPTVNPDWIYRGEGEPLQKAVAAPAGGNDVGLPIVSSLLPGPPLEHLDHLQGHEFPVAAALYRPSRCWYELSNTAAILQHDEAHLQAHDLLLLEHDPAQFGSLFDLNGKIVAAWVGSEARGQQWHLELGILEHHQGPDEETLSLCVGEPDYRRWKGVKFVSAAITALDLKTGRTLQFGEMQVPVQVSRDGTLTEIPENAQWPLSFPIQQHDVVAVCVGMFRR